MTIKLATPEPLTFTLLSDGRFHAEQRHDLTIRISRKGWVVVDYCGVKHSVHVALKAAEEAANRYHAILCTFER